MSDNDGKSNIIPFGKHKGRLIEEVLVDDPNYLQWLMRPAWFRDRHVALYQVIINRGAEPEETPEHNALQVLFLDDTFCIAFTDVVWPGWRDLGELGELGAKALDHARQALQNHFARLERSRDDTSSAIARVEERLKLKTAADRWDTQEAERQRKKAAEEMETCRTDLRTLPNTLTFEPSFARAFAVSMSY